MRTLTTLIIVLICALNVKAQSISGNLRSEAHESSLSYGNVDIYQEDVLVKSVLTDKMGNFKVDLDTGVYRCVFNYAGYMPIEKEIHVTKDEVANTAMEKDPSKPEKKKAESEGWAIDGREMTESIMIEEVAIRADKVGRGRAESRKFSRELEISSESGYDIPMGGAYMSTDDSKAPLMDEFDGDLGEADMSVRSGQLTAGEINDFSKWEMWQDLSKNELNAFAQAWKIAPEGRYSLQLTGMSGLPVVDALVHLISKSKGRLFTSRTDNTGKAELWLSTKGEKITLSDLFMEIEYMGLKETVRKVKPISEGINQHMFDISCYEINAVDIAFVVDATGSMGDELNYLQAEMNDVIFKAKQISDKLDFHFANVFYRDFGDAYVTQKMNFSRVLSESVEFVNAQQAGGGGDYEEAVEVALDTAINSLSWNESARSRILFLILDAPPHNTEVNRNKMEQLMRQAAEKGIRIVPVGASGINKATEYLLRTLAMGTNGTYTFLTNHSGIGGSHIEPSTDTYKVETFNDLMVRILKSYTYMPDCNQNISDLALEYPDSTVVINGPLDSLDVVVQDSLTRDSLDQQANQQIEIEWSYYPNPTTGLLNIRPGTDIDELFITDLTGKLLQSIKNMKKDRVEQADLSMYPTGIYLIRYMYENRWVTGKVVLQRW